MYLWACQCFAIKSVELPPIPCQCPLLIHPETLKTFGFWKILINVKNVDFPNTVSNSWPSSDWFQQTFIGNWRRNIAHFQLPTKHFWLNSSVESCHQSLLISTCTPCPPSFPSPTYKAELSNTTLNFTSTAATMKNGAFLSFSILKQ